VAIMYRRTVIAGLGAAGAIGAAGYITMAGPSYVDATTALWQPISPKDLPEAEYLVHHAVLAANSHNTQAWRFQIAPDEVLIQPDFTRATSIVDPDNHHLFASLGCAAENLMLAATALGRSASLTFDGPDSPLQISLGKGPQSTDPLFSAVTARQCTRSDYDGSAVSADDLSALETAADIPGISLLLLTDTVAIAPVLYLIITASSAQIADTAFREELRSWLRFSTARAIDTGDGLYSGCSGNPVLPNWLGKLLFGQFYTADAENEKLARQVKSSSGLAIFVSEQNDATHWVAAGRSYQRFALQATALGLKHAFLNQAVEVPETRTALAELLNLGDGRPDFIVRFGRAADMPRSLRRPLTDVIASARTV
jgi:hypothetical protein